MHQAQCSTVCKPHPVTDVVHPVLTYLCIGRINAVFLHHKKIEILHVCVVVRECSVYGFHLAHCLVEYKGAFTGLVHKLVFIFKSVDVAHHLADPGSGNLVLKLRAGNLHRLFGAGGGSEKDKKGN